MIYLDTHAVEALVNARTRWFSKEAQHALAGESEFRISPMVFLELEYLYEIGRTRVRARETLNKLAASIGLALCKLPFQDVALQAASESWTRDPFDRIIVAQARIAKAVLITRDSNILANYNKAVG